MVHQIKIKLRHNCAFLDLTQDFNGISYGYCNRSYDVLSLPGVLSEDQHQIAKERFPNYNSWKISTIQDRITYIQMSCLCEKLYNISITNLIQEEGGLIRYPISYENGFEYYTIMAFDKKISANIMLALDNIESEDIAIEILSNLDTGIEGLFRSQMISGPDLFEEITTKQLGTLIEAIELGYYEIPRTIRTKDIAELRGVQRYSVDKLLRKAENHIIKNLTPYLYFKQYLDGSD